MAAQWPLLRARLLTLLPALPGWNVVSVHAGAALDSVNRIFCTVGHSDDGVDTTAGTFTTVLDNDGMQYIEQGAVNCSLVHTDGAITLDAAYGELFPLLNQLDAAIRADRTLGVLGQAGETQLSVSVLSTQQLPGSALTVPFAVTYSTVT